MGKKSAPRALSDNEAMAYSKQIRVSPQKLNLVAQLIRGLNCDKALAALQFSRRRISNDVKKLLESAIANAENNHQLDVDRLYVCEATVGKTFVMKRWRPRARGHSAI
jgi:large subunit ribosomal protein L22